VRTPAGQARIARLVESEADAVMVMALEAGLSGLPVAQVVGRAGVAWHEHRALVEGLTRGGHAQEIDGVLIAASHLSAAEDAVVAVATRYHTSHPLEDGVPREELRERVFADASPYVFDHVLRALEGRKRIVARERVALAGHSVALSDEEVRARDAMIDTLRDAGLAPPDPATLATRIGVSLEVVNRIATLLLRRAVLIRVGDLLFHESALARLKAEILSLKQSIATGTIDVATFKERYSITRKYAIPLLEYLDRERVTKRVGDARKIL
jgi:selenocysteine-specific elongation factor